MIPSTDAYLHPPPRPKLPDHLYHNVIHWHILGACILRLAALSYLCKLSILNFHNHPSCTKLLQPACRRLLLAMLGIITLVRVSLFCQLSQTWPPYHIHFRPTMAGTLTQHIRMRFCDQPHSRLRIPLRIREAEVGFSVPQLQRKQERKGSLSAFSERCQSYEQFRMFCPRVCVVFLPDFVKISSLTMFVADKAISVGCTFGFNRE